ncbi:hypothetical protein [Chryseobacterium indoltheticum]|uniref:hypothetical protein n=1 Tax=Chryseobacterium indoltheticum TaxID=254 RepID=UPI003F490D59
MDQATPTTGEVPGTEKVSSEENRKRDDEIPVHLRPKSDDDLKQWKEGFQRKRRWGIHLQIWR